MSVATTAPSAPSSPGVPSSPGGPAVPILRRLPVPVAEPRPALRVVREVEPGVAPDQGTLPLESGSFEDGAADYRAADYGAADSGAADYGAAERGPADRGQRVLVAAAAERAKRLEAEAVARFCAAVPTPSSALPDPRRWAGQFVQAAVEVAAGQRPASQLVRWTSEDVHATLARRARLVARRTRLDGQGAALGKRPGNPNRVAVHSVRVCTPCDGVVEASAVVSDRARVRAVALRLEGLDGRWRVTALEIG